MTEPTPIPRGRGSRAQRAARPAPRAPRAPRAHNGDEDPAAVDRAAAAALEAVKPGPGAGDDDELLPGETEPVRISRRAGPDPAWHGRRIPADVGRVLEAPLKVSIRLYCPACDEPTIVEARLQARLTRDSDGAGAIALRTRAPKSAHVCGQPSLGLAEGPRDR